MAHTQFEPSKGGTQLFARCPKCMNAADVISFEVGPAMHGNGDFVEIWHLKAYVQCACGWEGNRSVGTLSAKGN